MTFEEWEAGVPTVIRSDSLWRMKAYRLGLFLADLGWVDAGKLVRDVRTTAIADQLYRAIGKISACIAEGYSRGSGKARAIFYEYALGSVRESRDWYYKARHILRDKVTSHRLELCTELTKLLITMIQLERRTNRPLSRPRD